MMKEDRALRLAGYEVYRFGGKELTAGDASRALLRQFFAYLLQKHGVISMDQLRRGGRNDPS